MDKVSLLVQRRIRLSHMVIVFLIRRHVDNFVRYARILRIGFVDLAVRRLNESVLVDPCVACKGVDQTDVRTFRRLDRTHSSVVGVVHIPHLESCTVSGKAARSSAERRLLWVSSASGLFRSMNWDSWEDPKNSFTAAVTGLILIRDCGEIPSCPGLSYAHARLSPVWTDRSCTGSGAARPPRGCVGCPRWSMSSSFPMPYSRWIL